MPSYSRFIILASVILLLLHIGGAVYPSHLTWGIHCFGFYSLPVQILALILAVLLFIPDMQAIALRSLNLLRRRFSSLSRKTIFIVLSIVLIIGSFLFSAKGNLLGDGAILLRSIPYANPSEEVPEGFRNQPLVAAIYFFSEGALRQVLNAEPHDVYFAIDLAAALVFLALVLACVERLSNNFNEQILLGCLLFFGAGSQFFFGYVENYVLQYITTTAYVLTGWWALERRVHISIPCLLYGLLCGFHLGNLIFLPSLIALILLRGKTNRLVAFGLLGGLGVGVIALFFAIGFNIMRFVNHILSGSPDFLPVLGGSVSFFPYSMFSLNHLIDWLNAHFLIVPFGLVIPFAAVLYSRELFRKNPVLIFLLIATGCGLLFTWIVNSALGIARDWDLFSGFFVPLMILDAYLLAHFSKNKHTTYILTLIVGLTSLHWSAWIGTNASINKHVHRVEMLDDPRLLSRSSQLFYFDALGTYFFDEKDYQRTRAYYERYVAISTSNVRILANLADVYSKLGEKDRYFELLKRTALLNTRDPGVYSNLGVEYSSRGDTATAISLNMKAVQLDPRQKEGHANLGLIYFKQGNYDLAVNHLTAAIELGLNDPPLYRAVGGAYVKLKEYDMALKWYNIYLGLVPADSVTRNLRDKVRNFIITQNKH